MDYRLTPDDKERVRLLGVVAKRGLKGMPLGDLRRLQSLVEKKDYGHSGKAERSKKRLLAKLNSAIYEAEEGSRWA